MTHPILACRLCGQPIDPGSRDYQMVSGWARNRGAVGGVNAIRMRVEHASYAHEVCVDKSCRGVNPNQLGFG